MRKLNHEVIMRSVWQDLQCFLFWMFRQVSLLSVMSQSPWSPSKPGVSWVTQMLTIYTCKLFLKWQWWNMIFWLLICWLSVNSHVYCTWHKCSRKHGNKDMPSWFYPLGSLDWATIWLSLSIAKLGSIKSSFLASLAFNIFMETQ